MSETRRSSVSSDSSVSTQSSGDSILTHKTGDKTKLVIDYAKNASNNDLKSGISDLQQQLKQDIKEAQEQSKAAKAAEGIFKGAIALGSVADFVDAILARLLGTSPDRDKIRKQREANLQETKGSFGKNARANEVKALNRSYETLKDLTKNINISKIDVNGKKGDALTCYSRIESKPGENVKMTQEWSSGLSRIEVDDNELTVANTNHSYFDKSKQKDVDYTDTRVNNGEIEFRLNRNMEKRMLDHKEGMISDLLLNKEVEELEFHVKDQNGKISDNPSKTVDLKNDKEIYTKDGKIIDLGDNSKITIKKQNNELTILRNKNKGEQVETFKFTGEGTELKMDYEKEDKIGDTFKVNFDQDPNAIKIYKTRDDAIEYANLGEDGADALTGLARGLIRINSERKANEVNKTKTNTGDNININTDEYEIGDNEEIGDDLDDALIGN